MYHNAKDTIELHDHVKGILSSQLERQSDGRLLLHTVSLIDPAHEVDESQPVRLHSTNGINHVYTWVGEPDPRLEMPVLPVEGEEAEAEPVEATPTEEKPARRARKTEKEA